MSKETMLRYIPVVMTGGSSELQSWPVVPAYNADEKSLIWPIAANPTEEGG